MAKTIAALNATLSLDARRFQQGMKRAKDPLRKFRAETRAAQDRLVRFANSLETTATKQSFLTGAIKRGIAAYLSYRALTAVVGVFKRTAEAIDDTAKASEKLGITTEALTALRFSAKLTGVEANTLDLAIQRMVRRLAEAAAGGGEAKAAVKELGIDARQLGRLTPDEQLKVLADAFQKVKTQADKVRLGFKLFDSEGVALVNTLALGRNALEDNEKAAQALGITVSQDMASSVEKMNDAWTRTTEIVKGLINKIVGRLAPALTDIANTFSIFIGGETAFDALLNQGLAEINAPKVDQDAADALAANRKKQEAAEKAAKKASASLDGFVQGLADKFRSPREIFLRELSGKAGATELGLADPRVDQAIRLFDKQREQDRISTRRAEVTSLLRGLGSEQESLVARLAGITTGELGIGGAAATGEVGSLAGAQAASTARQGFARLQRTNDESRSLLQQLVRIQQDIRFIQKNGKRVVNVPIAA